MPEIKWESSTHIWNAHRAFKRNKMYTRVFVEVIGVAGKTVTVRAMTRQGLKSFTVEWDPENEKAWLEYPSTLETNPPSPTDPTPQPPGLKAVGYLYLLDPKEEFPGQPQLYLEDPKWPAQLAAPLNVPSRRLEDEPLDTPEAYKLYRIWPTELSIAANGKAVNLLDHTLALQDQDIKIRGGSIEIRLSTPGSNPLDRTRTSELPRVMRRGMNPLHKDKSLHLVEALAASVAALEPLVAATQALRAID